MSMTSKIPINDTFKMMQEESKNQVSLGFKDYAKHRLASNHKEREHTEHN
jgi:hypothetical protein